MCRRAFSITSALCHHGRLTSEYGSNGEKGGSPSFSDHMLSSTGQAERRAFEARIAVRLRAIRVAAVELAPGAVHAGNVVSTQLVLVLILVSSTLQHLASDHLCTP